MVKSIGYKLTLVPFRLGNVHRAKLKRAAKQQSKVEGDTVSEAEIIRRLIEAHL